MICSVFWRIDDSGLKNLHEWYGRNIYAVHIAVNRWFFIARPALNGRARISVCRRGRLEAIGAEGTNGGHAIDGSLRLLEVRGDRLLGSIMERAA